MATTLSTKAPKAHPKVPHGTGEGAPIAGKKSLPAKKTGIAETFANDALDALNSPALSIRRAQAAKLSGPEIANATVLSEFPLSDLSQVKTVGRWAQGFRLDGGSLRLMWMNVRRTAEKDGTSGFEVAFQAQGPSVENFKLRMAKAGAVAGKYQFANAEVDLSAPDKAVLKRTGEQWGPSDQETLSLVQPGKWAVDYVTASPEALKGSFRIRLLGTDAEATAALSEVIKKLGMQALFSPPSPNALERFKLLRFIWQVAPGAADHLKYKPLAMLAEGLKEPAELAELNPESEKAIAQLKLDTPELKERAQLAELLYNKSPAKFLEWTLSQSDQHGMIPSGPTSAQSLRTALGHAGIPAESPELTAALAKTPSSDPVSPLFLLSLLAKTAPDAARAAIARDASTIKLAEIHDVLTAAGIDPAGDRVKNLRYEEVYPGYFTVIDPSLSVELEKAGARYLYSTSDNAERVWQMLTGGQKSSLTRFQEGVLIQGKSSDSDFGTGGAFSVFSRLVTDSVIKKAKNEVGQDDYYSGTKFEDWSGSRPYKLILNRRLLERTDWYAYNEDNFGNSKEATAANHGKKIIETINAEYSSSNEVMFPVGNDPSFVDFVVAPSEAHKKTLVDFLVSQGIQEFNGKKVEDFVIVRTKFFEHPDDLTLANAVAEAVRADGLAQIVQEALEPVKEPAKQSLDEKLGAIVDGLLASEGVQSIKSSASYYSSPAITAAVDEALAAKPDALPAFGLDTLAQSAMAAVTEAVEKRAKQYLTTGSYYSLYAIEQEIRNALEPKIPSSLAEEAFAKGLEQFLAKAQAPSADTPEVRAALRTELNMAIRDELRAAAEKLVTTEGTPFVQAHVEKLVMVDVPAKISATAKGWAKSALPTAAISAVAPEALAALLAELQAASAGPAEIKVRAHVTEHAAEWLKYSVTSKVEQEAKTILAEAMVAAATEPALVAAEAPLAALIKKASADFAAASPDKVNDAEEAKIPLAVKDAIQGLIKTASAAPAGAIAEQRSALRVGQALEELAKGPVYDELAKQMVADKLPTLARSSVENALRNAILAKDPEVFDNLATSVVSKTAESVKEQMLTQLVGPSLGRASKSLATQLWYDLEDKEDLGEKLGAAVDAFVKKALGVADTPAEAAPETPAVAQTAAGAPEEAGAPAAAEAVAVAVPVAPAAAAEEAGAGAAAPSAKASDA